MANLSSYTTSTTASWDSASITSYYTIGNDTRYAGVPSSRSREPVKDTPEQWLRGRVGEICNLVELE